MMRSIKHLVLGLSVLSFGSLVASELAAVDQKKPQQLLAQKNNGMQKKNDKEKPDPDATFCLPSSGGTAMAEFLWWGTNYNLPYWATGSNEKTTTQVSLVPNVTLDTHNLFAEVVRVAQKWSPGVRLSLGYVPGYDFMDLQLRWTYYENNAKGSGGDSTLVSGINRTGTAGIVGAHLNLKLVENVGDFELGKSYFTGSKVLLRPFCGVRAAWLHQNHHAFYQGRTFVNSIDGFTVPGNELPLHVQLKQNLWAVGPRIGLNSSWFKYCGLSVLANISTSLLYGKAHQSLKASDRSADENSGSRGSTQTQLSNFHGVVHDKFWEIFPQLQLMLGASWERCITQDLSIKLFASWEANFWWEASNILYFDRPLSTEGLTAGIGMTF